MSKYDLRERIFLLGDIEYEIHGNKLPSNKQMLKVLFFNLRKLKLSVRESASSVVKEICHFWEKARIPTQSPQKCIEKVEKLYRHWRALQKRRGQKSNEAKEAQFRHNLELLFDIAAANCLTVVDERRAKFLENQRKPERIGFIRDIETNDDDDDENEIELKRKRAKYERETTSYDQIVELVSIGDSSHPASSMNSFSSDFMPREFFFAE